MKTINVLIVDDVPFMRQFIKSCLQMSFPEINAEESSNGSSARERLQSIPFDLVLCDWEMPSLKGDELLQWMRSEEDTRDTPFIMITGKREKEFIIKALELGVTDYIIKPVNCDTLAKKIISALKGRR
ncbi:MAG: response regulator [Alphaproteobacteria bacterium]|uniref:Response regulator n=1 Tax=Candidatus Nitrobium versatile TaxID=2884831 RepID=A0A953M2D5_9BACT|nr:response regulator [Candidatus Nitrobium versatile]